MSETIPGAAGRARLEQAFGAHLPLAGARLAGKAALISGAGFSGSVLGTGAATAMLFAAQGAAVTVFDVDQARGENTVRAIGELGGRALQVVGDARSAADCSRAVEETAALSGGLDILMNNVAVTGGGDINTVVEADWDRVIDINLKSVMLLSHAAMPHLVARRGAVVNVASIAATQGLGSIAYSAAKGGVVAMTRDMAYTAGPSGVRVNCLVPGHLATPMGGAHIPDNRDRRRRVTLLRTEGNAWDIAWAALFLAGPEARWITATTLTVDAGSTMHAGFNVLREAEAADR